MKVNYIFNGVGHGSVLDRLAEYNFDPRGLQPWRSKKNGLVYVTHRGVDGVVRNHRLVTNAPTPYTKDAWIKAQDTIIRVRRSKLRVWDDLQNEGLTYTVPEGMGVTMLQEQVMSDVGEARFTMDGTAKSRRDRPEVTLRNFPLPLITADMSFTGRQMAVSNNGLNRLPLDTTMLEMNTRAIDQKIENMCIGTETYRFAGETIYGLTNHPQRVTTTLTLPTAGGWTPSLLVDEILDMIQDLQDMDFNGPYGMYFSRGWGKYFNGDYTDTYGGETLLTRMRKVDGIKWMRQLDGLGTGYKIVLFQLDSMTIRAVTITPLRVLQWAGMGGLTRHWKLLAGMVPQLRTNADNEIGINHAVAS